MEVCHHPFRTMGFSGNQPSIHGSSMIQWYPHGPWKPPQRFGISQPSIYQREIWAYPEAIQDHRWGNQRMRGSKIDDFQVKTCLKFRHVEICWNMLKHLKTCWKHQIWFMRGLKSWFRQLSIKHPEALVGSNMFPPQRIKSSEYVKRRELKPWGRRLGWSHMQF